MLATIPNIQHIINQTSRTIILSEKHVEERVSEHTWGNKLYESAIQLTMQRLSDIGIHCTEYQHFIQTSTVNMEQSKTE
jgi:hypothetical protein